MAPILVTVHYLECVWLHLKAITIWQFSDEQNPSLLCIGLLNKVNKAYAVVNILGLIRMNMVNLVNQILYSTKSVPIL